jgi:hypothetical protein
MNTEQKMYFSIKTIQSSGLGDQLGTQFARLYSIGKVLGMEYIYTTITFPRSVKPIWYEYSQVIIFKIRFFLLYFFGQNLFSSAINALLLKFEKYLNNKLSKHKDNLSSFLGLKNISQLKLAQKSAFYDIYLDELFEIKKIKTLVDLQSYFQLIKSKDDNVVFNLCWTANMWKLIPQIDNLLKESEGYELEKQQIFSNVFNLNHPKNEQNKINIAFHIRCGDSTTVHLNDMDLIVYDKYLYSSEKEMMEIFSIDKDRHSVLPEEYLVVYKEILNNLDKDKIRITLISDGFDLTYRNIFRNLLKRKNKIKLSIQNRRLLLKKSRKRNLVFKQFDESNLILGESQHNLENSILALANADVVIWGCGGFACNTNNLFKKKNKKSLLFNVKSFDSENLNLIKNMINA